MIKCFKIYVGMNNETGKVDGYSLLGCTNAVNELSKNKWLLKNVSLPNILMYLDLIGGRNKLVDRKNWESSEDLN